MPTPFAPESPVVAPIYAASQHRPRPLPLFLELLRRETAGDPARLAAALAGLRRYQAAPRSAPPPPAPILARAGRAVLRDYGAPHDPAVMPAVMPTVLFVPSLINPPSVLDLAADRSLLRWLATRGLRPLLLDWGTPTPADARQDIAGHVETMLLPLIDALGTPPALVGYCLGGTMAIAAAARRPVRGLALLATPWSFAGFPDPARADLAALWARTAPAADRLGLLPMEMLQPLFWQLDPARTAARFVDFATAPDIAGRIALEDWANDGPPLTLAAGRDLFETLFRDDRPGRGTWSVAGSPVDPARIACPVLDIVSSGDRIVPAATALSGVSGLPGRRGGIDAHVLALGHVGMVAGTRARAALWEPLADWLYRLP